MVKTTPLWATLVSLGLLLLPPVVGLAATISFGRSEYRATAIMDLMVSPSSDGAVPYVAQLEEWGDAYLELYEIKKQQILSEVIAQHGVRLSLDELGRRIQVTKRDPSFIEIRVWFPSKELSLDLASAVSDVFFSEYGAYFGEGVALRRPLVYASRHPAVGSVPWGPLQVHPVLFFLLVSLAAGLLMGLVWALHSLLYEMVKTPTLKTAEDVARATQLPILGCMPVVKEITTPSLVAAHQPMSPISEAFRTIFANVCGSPTDGPLRTLIITSPQAGEGKTKLLANLGIVMAQAGNSVVLVDTNLRHPLLHKEFDLPNREGLTDALLQDEPEPGPLLQATQVANLRVLSSGPLSPDTPQLLGSQKMRRLIARLKNEADFILFDTLPILPVTDAAVWAIETDGVLLVVMARRTRRLALQRAVDRLLSLGIDVVGVVLNRRPVRLMET